MSYERASTTLMMVLNAASRRFDGSVWTDAKGKLAACSLVSL